MEANDYNPNIHTDKTDLNSQILVLQEFWNLNLLKQNMQLNSARPVRCCNRPQWWTHPTMTAGLLLIGNLVGYFLHTCTQIMWLHVLGHFGLVNFQTVAMLCLKTVAKNAVDPAPVLKECRIHCVLQWYMSQVGHTSTSTFKLSLQCPVVPHVNKPFWYLHTVY